MLKKSATNPFYVLLVLVGTLFAVTAFAYGVMSVDAMRQVDRPPKTRTTTFRRHPLWEWLDRYGPRLLTGEVMVLALATAGAIGTDEYWQRRMAPPDRPLAE